MENTIVTLTQGVHQQQNFLKSAVQYCVPMGKAERTIDTFDHSPLCTSEKLDSSYAKNTICGKFFSSIGHTTWQSRPEPKLAPPAAPQRAADWLAEDMSGAQIDPAARHEWDPEEYSWDGVTLMASRKPRQGRANAAAGPSAYSEYLGKDVPMLMSRPPVGALSKAQRLVCQIQGCNRNLQQSKLYYQRFKLCEEHLKSPAISIDGVLSRLCQQCGRFHDLSAFEGKKRTCRAQLDRIRKAKEQRKRNVGSSGTPERDVDADGEDTRAADTRATGRKGSGRAEGGAGSSGTGSSGTTSSGSAKAATAPGTSKPATKGPTVKTKPDPEAMGGAGDGPSLGQLGAGWGMGMDVDGGAGAGAGLLGARDGPCMTAQMEGRVLYDERVTYAASQDGVGGACGGGVAGGGGPDIFSGRSMSNGATVADALLHAVHLTVDPVAEPWSLQVPGGISHHADNASLWASFSRLAPVFWGLGGAGGVGSCAPAAGPQQFGLEAQDQARNKQGGLGMAVAAAAAAAGPGCGGAREGSLLGSAPFTTLAGGSDVERELQSMLDDLTRSDAPQQGAPAVLLAGGGGGTLLGPLTAAAGLAGTGVTIGGRGNGALDGGFGGGGPTRFTPGVMAAGGGMLLLNQEQQQQHSQQEMSQHHHPASGSPASGHDGTAHSSPSGVGTYLPHQMASLPSQQQLLLQPQQQSRQAGSEETADALSAMMGCTAASGGALPLDAQRLDPHPRPLPPPRVDRSKAGGAESGEGDAAGLMEIYHVMVQQGLLSDPAGEAAGSASLLQFGEPGCERLVQQGRQQQQRDLQQLEHLRLQQQQQRSPQHQHQQQQHIHLQQQQQQLQRQQMAMPQIVRHAQPSQPPQQQQQNQAGQGQRQALSGWGGGGGGGQQRLGNPHEGGATGGGAADGMGSKYTARDTMTRVTLKLMNCLPDDLPRHLRANLQRWARSGSATEVLQACMRPGCLELVIDFVHSLPLEDTEFALSHQKADEAQRTLNRVVTDRLAEDNEIVVEVGELVLIAPPSGRDPPIILTWEEAAAFFADVDNPTSRAPASNDQYRRLVQRQQQMRLPHHPIAAVSGGGAAAVKAAAAGGIRDDDVAATVHKPKPAIEWCSLVAACNAPVIVFNVTGAGLADPDVSLCARMGGQRVHLGTAKLPPNPRISAGLGYGQNRVLLSTTLGGAPTDAAASPPDSQVRLAIHARPSRQAGLLILEARRGRLLGPWWPVLVVPEPLVAAELNAMATEAAAPAAAVAAAAAAAASAGEDQDVGVVVNGYNGSPAWIRSFLIDLGQVLDWVGWQGHDEVSQPGDSRSMSGSVETWGSGYSADAAGASGGSGGGCTAAAAQAGTPPVLGRPIVPSNRLLAFGAPPHLAPPHYLEPAAAGATVPTAATASSTAAPAVTALPPPPPACSRGNEFVSSYGASRESAVATGDGSWTVSYESHRTTHCAQVTTESSRSGYGTSADHFGRLPDRSNSDNFTEERALAALKASQENLARRLHFKACRLLAFSVARGLVHTAGLLWSILAIQGMNLDAVFNHALHDGEGLLMCAVRSRSPVMLRALLSRGQGSWASQDVYRMGPSGLSPLHLAASLPECGDVADLLLESVRGAPQAWFMLRSPVGFTPAQMALRYGHGRLNAHALRLLRQSAEADPGAGLGWVVALGGAAMTSAVAARSGGVSSYLQQLLQRAAELGTPRPVAAPPAERPPPPPPPPPVEPPAETAEAELTLAVDVTDGVDTIAATADTAAGFLVTSEAGAEATAAAAAAEGAAAPEPQMVQRQTLELEARLVEPCLGPSSSSATLSTPPVPGAAAVGQASGSDTAVQSTTAAEGSWTVLPSPLSTSSLTPAPSSGSTRAPQRGGLEAFAPAPAARAASTPASSSSCSKMRGWFEKFAFCGRPSDDSFSH